MSKYSKKSQLQYWNKKFTREYFICNAAWPPKSNALNLSARPKKRPLIFFFFPLVHFMFRCPCHAFDWGNKRRQERSTREDNAKLIGPTCLGSGSIASFLIPDFVFLRFKKIKDLFCLPAKNSGIFNLEEEKNQAYFVGTIFSCERFVSISQLRFLRIFWHLIRILQDLRIKLLLRINLIDSRT